MSRDVLRFYQAYINEMSDLGGENLPKSISSRLGAKLAHAYKYSGINNIQTGLKTLFGGMKARIKIREIEEGIIEVITKYNKKFCPIGGWYDHPDQAEKTQDMICKPYILGFLSEMDPDYKYSGESKKCILKDNGKHCIFQLKCERKNNNSEVTSNQN